MRGVISGAMLMALHTLGLRDAFDAGKSSLRKSPSDGVRAHASCVLHHSIGGVLIFASCVLRSGTVTCSMFALSRSHTAHQHARAHTPAALASYPCLGAVYGASAGAINLTYFLSGQPYGLDIYAEDLTGVCSMHVLEESFVCARHIIHACVSKCVHVACAHVLACMHACSHPHARTRSHACTHTQSHTQQAYSQPKSTCT